MLHEIKPFTYHVEYLNREACDGDYLLLYHGNSVLCQDSDAGVTVPTVAEAGGIIRREELKYLFRIDGMYFYGAPGAEVKPFSKYDYIPLFFLRQRKPKHIAYGAAVGGQMTGWYEKTRFCGKCGRELIHDGKERMMRCPECGNMIFPQICPCVIVAVTHRGRILCTRYNPNHMAPPPADKNAKTTAVSGNGTTGSAVHYALIAGYMETGETPEETICREVKEEVGLRVKNIRYYSCQPWPFSGSLLFGYFAELDGDSENITLEEDELSEAVWLTPEELPDRSMDGSLTSEMLEAFRTGKQK